MQHIKFVENILIIYLNIINFVKLNVDVYYKTWVIRDVSIMAYCSLVHYGSQTIIMCKNIIYIFDSDFVCLTNAINDCLRLNTCVVCVGNFQP